MCWTNHEIRKNHRDLFQISIPWFGTQEWLGTYPFHDGVWERHTTRGLKIWISIIVNKQVNRCICFFNTWTVQWLIINHYSKSTIKGTIWISGGYRNLTICELKFNMIHKFTLLRLCKKEVQLAQVSVVFACICSDVRCWYSTVKMFNNCPQVQYHQQYCQYIYIYMQYVKYIVLHQHISNTMI